MTLPLSRRRRKPPGQSDAVRGPPQQEAKLQDFCQAANAVTSQISQGASQPLSLGPSVGCSPMCLPLSSQPPTPRLAVTRCLSPGVRQAVSWLRENVGLSVRLSQVEDTESLEAAQTQQAALEQEILGNSSSIEALRLVSTSCGVHAVWDGESPSTTRCWGRRGGAMLMASPAAGVLCNWGITLGSPARHLGRQEEFPLRCLLGRDGSGQ